MPRGSRGDWQAVAVLSEVDVDIVAAQDETRFRDLMHTHHYLGAVPGMGETVRYVAHHRGRWLALAVFSAPALKCGARDRWIGWERGLQFGRLHLVTNNSRFLILPGGPRNLGSRVLSLCTSRVVRDWPTRFGHDVLLAETFVDPALFRGTVYRAANWVEVGRTRGFARGGAGYSEHARPKLVFVHPLCRGARARLRAADLDPPPATWSGEDDAQRRTDAIPSRVLPRHRRPPSPPGPAPCSAHGAGLSPPPRRCAACAATRRSANGSTISVPRVLQRFRVRRRDGQYRPPSLSAMRSLLIRVDPVQLDAALRAWHEAHGLGDSALAIDGKTIRGAIDDDGKQAHVLGIIGHDTNAPWGQKQSWSPRC